MVKETEISEGYQKIEIGVIPNDWEIFTIEELTPKNKKYCIVDGPFGSNLKTIHYRKSGIPIITSGYVTDGKFNATDYLYVDIEKFKQEKRSAVKGGDIVMAKIGANCGASAILPIKHPEGILSGNALKITIDESRFSTMIISQILWRNYSIGKFEELRTTGAQPAISMANLKKFKLPLPASKFEQTAIASALSDTDALIENLEKLIIKKRNIKQGAMQELLTGKRRLTGFNYEWVVKSLSEVIDCLDNLRIPLNESQRASMKGDYPYCGANGILDYINDYCIDDEFILIAEDGGYFDEYMYRPIAYKMSGKCWVNNHAHILKAKENYNQDFIYYSLVHKNILRFLTSGTRAKLNKSEMYNIEIDISPSINEQSAIANILTDMDAEIEALEQKLHKYRMIKQGMMQVLLTGKIRLI
jgi:type I restriction enzyme, S subunit